MAVGAAGSAGICRALALRRRLVIARGGAEAASSSGNIDEQPTGPVSAASTISA